MAFRKKAVSLGVTLRDLEKSNSFSFFIYSPLPTISSTGTDEPYISRRPAPSEHDNKNALPKIADEPLPPFTRGVSLVFHDPTVGVAESNRGHFEGDPMLDEIAFRLAFIPLEGLIYSVHCYYDLSMDHSLPAASGGKGF